MKLLIILFLFSLNVYALTTSNNTFTMGDSSTATKALNMDDAQFKYTPLTGDLDISIDDDKVFTVSTSGLTSEKVFSFSDGSSFDHIASPSEPVSGKCLFYAKSDDNFYKYCNGGSETQVGAGSTPNAIQDSGATTKITTEVTANELEFTANSVITASMASTSTTIHNDIYLPEISTGVEEYLQLDENGKMVTTASVSGSVVICTFATSSSSAQSSVSSGYITLTIDTIEGGSCSFGSLPGSNLILLDAGDYGWCGSTTCSATNECGLGVYNNDSSTILSQNGTSYVSGGHYNVSGCGRFSLSSQTNIAFRAFTGTTGGAIGYDIGTHNNRSITFWKY